jgi:hypothetical protein
LEEVAIVAAIAFHKVLRTTMIHYFLYVQDKVVLLVPPVEGAWSYYRRPTTDDR